jgi:predicted nucleic acid binding AN1-type Zn finger protein
MADEADLAFDSQQQHLAHSLAVQSKRGGALAAVGSCHFCGEDVGPEGRLFCDADCAVDWEYQNALRRRLGLSAEVLHS